MRYMTDHELLTLFAISRDAAAFTQIVQRYESLVFRVCLRKLGNPSDAADATQQVFVDLWQTRPAIHTNFRSWIIRCAINISISQIRKDTARRRREQHSAAPETTSQHPFEHRETCAILRQLWRQLEHTDQHLIQQIIIERQSQSVIAKQLGVSQQAVAKRKHKIITQMREVLLERGVTFAFIGCVALLRRVSQAASAIGQKFSGTSLSSQTIATGCLVTGLLLAPTSSQPATETRAATVAVIPSSQDDSPVSMKARQDNHPALVQTVATNYFTSDAGKAAISQTVAIHRSKVIVHDAGAELLGRQSPQAESTTKRHVSYHRNIAAEPETEISVQSNMAGSNESGHDAVETLTVATASEEIDEHPGRFSGQKDWGAAWMALPRLMMFRYELGPFPQQFTTMIHSHDWPSEYFTLGRPGHEIAISIFDLMPNGDLPLVSSFSPHPGIFSPALSFHSVDAAGMYLPGSPPLVQSISRLPPSSPFVDAPFLPAQIMSSVSLSTITIPEPGAASMLGISLFAIYLFSDRRSIKSKISQ